MSARRVCTHMYQVLEANIIDITFPCYRTLRKNCEIYVNIFFRFRELLNLFIILTISYSNNVVTARYQDSWDPILPFHKLVGPDPCNPCAGGIYAHAAYISLATVVALLTPQRSGPFSPSTLRTLRAYVDCTAALVI